MIYCYNEDSCTVWRWRLSFDVGAFMFVTQWMVQRTVCVCVCVCVCLCVSGFVKYKRAKNQYRSAEMRLQDWDEIYNHTAVMDGIQQQAAR